MGNWECWATCEMSAAWGWRCGEWRLAMHLELSPPHSPGQFTMELYMYVCGGGSWPSISFPMNFFNLENKAEAEM